MFFCQISVGVCREAPVTNLRLFLQHGKRVNVR